MKKIVLTVLFASACLVGLAEDSVLWWQVDSANVEPWAGTYNLAYLYANAEGELPDPVAVGRLIDDGESNLLSAGAQTSTKPLETTLKVALANCSFWVELFNDSTLVGTSAHVSYADLKDFITTYDPNNPSAGPNGAWSPTIQAIAVPEPTSGLLMLLGLAGLALRRRHVV